MITVDAEEGPGWACADLRVHKAGAWCMDNSGLLSKMWFSPLLKVPPWTWTQNPVLSSSFSPSWDCPSVVRSLGSEPLCQPCEDRTCLLQPLPVGSSPFQSSTFCLSRSTNPVTWGGGRCIFYLLGKNNKVSMSLASGQIPSPPAGSLIPCRPPQPLQATSSPADSLIPCSPPLPL